MKPSQLFLATLAMAFLSFGSQAFAQEATQAAWAASTRTRADVMAELAQARKDGSIKVRSVTYGQAASSTQSRDEVRAELAQARAYGSINFSSVTYGQPAASTRARDDVRAEMAHSGAKALHREL